MTNPPLPHHKHFLFADRSLGNSSPECLAVSVLRTRNMARVGECSVGPHSFLLMQEKAM